jgi:hypothetical protein
MFYNHWWFKKDSSGPHGGVWYPDLRKNEQYLDIDLLVKF